MSATMTSIPTCDNCAQMDMHVCGDGLLHRFCTAMILHIADWNINGVCSYHKPYVKGGAK